MNHKRFSKCFIFMFLIVIAFLSTKSLSADSYWKVTGWERLSYSYYGYDHAILVRQDCNMTEPGYGWFRICNSPTPIYLMIRNSDPMVAFENSEFIYNGTDRNGVPFIIHWEDYYYGGCGLILDPFPPCMAYTPTNFMVNGNSYPGISVENMEPIIFSARYASSSNNYYYISLQASYENWMRYGPLISEWMLVNQCPYYFNHSSFDIRRFCELHNFQLVQGNLYQLSYTNNPWQPTNKMIYIVDFLKIRAEQIPVMTSNTTPMGIASASSIYSSGYAAWKAFDGNDVSETWSRWISYPGQFPAWITYEFCSSLDINSYYILPEYGTTTKNRSPRNWQLLGWNGYCWDVLDTRTNIRNDIEWTAKGLSFRVKNPGRYSKYRLYITAVNGSDVVSIRQFKLLF